MADTGFRMNFSALKRADPYARDIVDSASHVALYTFEENEWEKTNIEGALFVYGRNGEPYHSLVIMNRLNTNNLIEPVSKGLELQLKEPFLLYRNSKCRIYGIWFYDKDECVRVATKLYSLVKECIKQSGCSDQMSQSGGFGGNPPIGPSVDIFTMLSKAQDDYHSHKGVVANKTEFPTPRPPDMTSQSVMDFFAKAGIGASQLPPVPNLPSPGIFGPMSSDSREAPFFMHRLMSNPAHSVEHIEKQQRSVTPQEPLSANGNPGLDGSLRQNNSIALISTPTEKHIQQLTTQKSVPSAKKVSDINGQMMLESELSFMNISSPKPASPLAMYLSQPQENNHTKPALMPPTMFTATTSGDSLTTPEPLTRNQLLQAFNYLLKHDADFVNKLHEAYVKSFSEKPFSVS